MYTTLKFIHVASIAIWFGGLVTLLLLNRMLARGTEPAVAQVLGRQGGALSMRLFIPAMLVSVITGIGMVQVGNLSFGSTWIIWGMVGVVVSFVLGAIFTGGASRRLAQRLASGEIDAVAAAAVQRRIFAVALVNVALLLSIVWAMVAKPQ
ncbi:MAG: DUF2269 family protein [Gemmatimonadota bacterium]